MKPFKFFQKEVKGTLGFYEGESTSTASFNDDTYHFHRPRIEDQERQERMMSRLRMEENYRDLNDNLVKMSQSTRATRVNPKWWMKIKMFFQKINMHVQYNNQLMGVITLSTFITVGVGLIIAKILNVW